MRILLTFLLAAWTGAAAAQIVSRDSLHLKPAGAKVSGSFVLVNKTVPLPEGEFALLATEIRETKFGYGDYARQAHRMVDVALAQVVDGKVRASVVATTLLAWGGGRREWTDEPCKRDDTLFKHNAVPFMKKDYSQNCLIVNHFVNSLGDSARGVYAKAGARIREQGIATPLPTQITASITRVELAEWLAVHYAFNPQAYGCAGGRATTWAASPWHKSRIATDPEKVRFVDGVSEFGKAMQLRVNEAFEGRRQVAESLAAATPQVQPCGGKS